MGACDGGGGGVGGSFIKAADEVLDTLLSAVLMSLVKNWKR